MIVWTKKAESDYAARHGNVNNPRKAGTLAKWGEVVVADDDDLIEAFLCRGWIKEDKGKLKSKYDTSSLIDYNSYQSRRVQTLHRNTVKRAKIKWLQILHYIDLGMTRNDIAKRMDWSISGMRKWIWKWRPMLKELGDINFKAKKE